MRAVNVFRLDAHGNIAGDWDIVLKNAVIEVKSGGAKGLVKQMLKEQASTDLPLLGYAPNAGGQVMKDALRAGLTVTRDRHILIEVVAPDPFSLPPPPLPPR